MIYGIGTDMCAVARIEKSMEKQTFLRHVYTEAEQALLQARTGKARAETAAANFAAKEALLKACGTGLAGFGLNQIAALRRDDGAPYYRCSGALQTWLEQNQLRAHLSLSHENGIACAFAVLEKV